jgi:1-acyl-sn-glycerol-3-phosphate acyltransferase
MKASAAFASEIYGALVFVPLLLASTLAFGVAAVLLAPLLGPRRVNRICGRGWARVNAAVAGLRVRVEGAEHLGAGRSFVIIANHQSHLDVLAAYGWLDADFRWVMKGRFRTLPALGAACERMGHFFIDDSSHAAAVASLAAARQRIRDGTSIFFFAEGDHSPDGRLQPFKRGAFRVAIELGLPILPITICGTRRALLPGTIALRPGCARLRIHPPVPVAPGDELALRALIDRVAAAIASALPEPEAEAHATAERAARTSQR